MIFLVKLFPFIVAWAIVKCSIRKDKILFLQTATEQQNETLIVMTWTENEENMTAGCEIFTDTGLINETLASNVSHIRTLTEDEMQILVGDCIVFNHQRKKRDVDDVSIREVTEDDAETDYDELSSVNRRRSDRRNNRRSYGRRSGSRNRTSYKRNNKEREMKSNGTITTSSPSTTVSLNEIDDEYDKVHRQKSSENRTSSKSEIERESEESFDVNVTTPEPSTTLGYDGLPIIFPGTKWCGAGAVAKNYSDLGRYEDTDECCRAHDLCNDTLAPGETRHNLTNTSPFTKLSCQCDEEFYNCLDNIRSIPANSIGNMYFNLLGRECYALEYPESKICKKYLTIFKITCLEYERDTSKRKVYQWIQPNRYSLIKKAK